MVDEADEPFVYGTGPTRVPKRGYDLPERETRKRAEEPFSPFNYMNMRRSARMRGYEGTPKPDPITDTFEKFNVPEREITQLTEAEAEQLRKYHDAKIAAAQEAVSYISIHEREAFESIDEEQSMSTAKEPKTEVYEPDVHAWIMSQIAYTERRLSKLHEAAKLSGQLKDILGDIYE